MMNASIIQIGEVRHISAGQTTVAVAKTGCASCGHLGGCAVGNLSAARSEQLITLPNHPGLACGDRVALEIDQAQLTRAALQGYLMPILLLLCGAILGDPLHGSLGAPLGALAGLSIGLLLARRGNPVMPRLVRVTASE